MPGTPWEAVFFKGVGSLLTSGQVMRDLRLSTFTVEDTPLEEEKRDWQRLIASYLVGPDILAAVKPRHYQRVAAFDLFLPWTTP